MTVPLAGSPNQVIAGPNEVANGIAARLMWPLIVFLLGFLPRVFALGRRPFWYDEILTLQRASLPFSALIRDSFVHHHLPTYFLIVAPFAGTADPQFWLRFPSAIFGALSVMLAYLVATRAAGRGAGLAAACILGLAPTQIAFAQDARSYTLIICLILLALHGLVGLVLARDRVSLAWTAPDAPHAAWAAFTAGSAAAICVLGDSLPWLLVAALVAVLITRRASRRTGALRNFLAAGAMILAPALPLYGALLALQEKSSGFGWIPKPSRGLIGYDIGSIYLMRVSDFNSFHFIPVRTPLAVAWLLGAGLVVACAASAWRLHERPLLLATLLLAFVTLPVLFGIISLRQPILLPRYILWSAAPFAILAGIGFDALLGRLCGPYPAIAAGTGLALLLVNLWPFYGAETKPRWDLAAKLLAAESGPDDLFFLFEQGANPTMRYYLPKPLESSRLLHFTGDLRRAAEARANGRRVWVVYGPSLSTSGVTPAVIHAALAVIGPVSFVQQAGARISIWRFDPAPARSP